MKKINQNNQLTIAQQYQKGWTKALDQLRNIEKDLSVRSKSTQLFLLLVLFNSVFINSYAQDINQTVRGQIIDQEAQIPIIGATVILLGSSPLKGSSTDVDGNFSIDEVPVGRHTLKITSIGYEDVVLPEIMVISGKESVLNIQMRESLTQLQEIVISAEQSEKGEPLNEMAMVSARSFTVEETQRYAASVNDPARMALSFAGVASSDDGTNDIIVRGNSPRGVLWRLQGIEIPNPNHFGEEGAAGGGITMLSANMLSTSDFYTGAFPAEYGNAFSAVFDLNLRRGNNSKKEYAAQAGLLGVDFAAEGPFNANQKGSYLVNYRYSTLAILDQIGLGESFGDAIPDFQDLSFNIHLPTEKAGSFSVWGIGGLSNQQYVDDEEDYDFYYNMGVGGITHRVFLSKNSYLESVLSASSSVNGFDLEADEDDEIYEDKFVNNTVRGSILYNNKLNSRHTLRVGGIVSYRDFDLLQQYSDVDTTALEADAAGSTYLYQGFAQLKTRINERLSANLGLHTMALALNGHTSIEPRAGIRYDLSSKSNISVGYGIHSKLEALAVYYSRVGEQGDLPNKDMDFMQAHHFVLGYENMLKPQLRFKMETYYQMLQNVPIAASTTADPEWITNSLLNYNGGLVNHPLANDGEGRNYGVELTLEKSFTDNYYFTITSSLYESKYTGRDGIERDTRFNGNFTGNILAGKEYRVGNKGNNILGLNIRLLTAGGNRWTPIVLNESIEKGEAVYDYENRFSLNEGIYFRTDLRISYRKNKKKYSSIWSLDIQNASNHQNLWAQYYDEEEQKIDNIYQVGLLPVLSYKIEF